MVESNLNQSRASPISPMGPLFDPRKNKLVRCPTCGCEWGIRDMLIPTNADPYHVLGSRMTISTHIQCGLCGRTLE